MLLYKKLIIFILLLHISSNQGDCQDIKSEQPASSVKVIVKNCNNTILNDQEETPKYQFTIKPVIEKRRNPEFSPGDFIKNSYDVELGVLDSIEFDRFTNTYQVQIRVSDSISLNRLTEAATIEFCKSELEEKDSYENLFLTKDILHGDTVKLTIWESRGSGTIQIGIDLWKTVNGEVRANYHIVNSCSGPIINQYSVLVNQSKWQKLVELESFMRRIPKRSNEIVSSSDWRVIMGIDYKGEVLYTKELDVNTKTAEMIVSILLITKEFR